MGVGLVATCYTLFAAVAAWFCAPAGESQKTKIAIAWALSTAIGFFISLHAAAFFFLGVLYAVLASGPPKLRVYVFLGVFAALPDYYGFSVPFPGLNYLLTVDTARLSTIVILLPAFFLLLSRKVGKGFRSADIILIALTLLIGVMSLRVLPATSALRSMTYFFLMTFVPYFCISRALDSQKAIDDALKALFVSLCIIAFIGVIITVFRWNYFANLGGFHLGKIHWDTRNGLLRVYATMTPAVIGYIMACGFVLVFYLRSIGALKKMYVYPLAGLFGFICFATGSRAALLGLMVTAATYWFSRNSTSGQRRTLVMLGLVGVVALVVGVMTGSLTLEDEYGTFDYRADLLQIGLRQIGNAPFFGNANVSDLPAFQQLIQGEGLVDLVNAYLMIALLYGLVGAYLYYATFFIAIRRLLKGMSVIDQRSGKKKADDPEELILKSQLALLLSLLVGFLTVLATTSGISYLFNYGFIVMAVGITAGVLAQRSEAPSEEAEILPEEITPDPTVAAPARVPYGARFVRRI